MQKRVENKVLEYCKKHKLLDQGDRIVVGVSGGADSVCLLFVLLSLQKEYDLKIHVVHVHHGIRPEAGEDAAYVEKLCLEKGLPFTLVRRDIPTEAKAHGCSEEEAGRKARYEVFEEFLKKEGAQKIAVAHNANDRAETMLFHLFRGTGLTGLSSIRPMREQVIRPILCLERAEIEAYLENLCLDYCHDKTNDSDDYTRNKIRHHILPYAEAEIVDGAVGNMVRTADILAETENYIEEQVQKAKAQCVEATEGLPGYRLRKESFDMLPVFMKKRLLLELLKELSPGHKDIAAVHVEDVCRLFREEGNRELHLPYGIRARKQYEEYMLTLDTQTPVSKGFETVSIPLENIGQEELVIPLGWGRRIYLKRINVPEKSINQKDIPQNQYTKWFDYDKIVERLELRTRRVGDYFTLKSGESLQHKKVKDYMITEKIPKARREEIPLLAEGEHVLWMVGYRISEHYKVEEYTKNILEVHFEQTNKITER